MAKLVSFYTGIMCLMPKEVDQLDRVENLDVVRETNVIYDLGFLFSPCQNLVWLPNRLLGNQICVLLVSCKATLWFLVVKHEQLRFIDNIVTSETTRSSSQ